MDGNYIINEVGGYIRKGATLIKVWTQGTLLDSSTWSYVPCSHLIYKEFPMGLRRGH